MLNIQPIILSGGSGTRLWPLSSSTTPKQFIKLNDNDTFLDKTTKRINRCKELNYNWNDIYYVMNEKYQNINSYANTYYEKHSNDTAIAVYRTILELKHKLEPNTILIFFPADHYIDNDDNFVSDICAGLEKLTEKSILLFGITPNANETKYGYILEENNHIKFLEKPNSDIAQELIDQGALWNSGIFAAKLNTLLHVFKNNKYNLQSWIDDDNNDTKGPSFDVAILQEYDELILHKCNNWLWSDIGTWESFLNIKDKLNSNNNNRVLKNCSNIDIIDNHFENIISIGCNDILLVVNDKNLLLVNKNCLFDNELKSIINNF